MYWNLLNATICINLCTLPCAWFYWLDNDTLQPHVLCANKKTLPLSCKNIDCVERFGTVSIVMKYYNKHSTKSEIKTHPVRKNMAASVFFPEKRAFCRCCLQARSYLLQRGGCGQCWEALLMGWLVLVLGLCGMVVIVPVSPGYRKRLVLCRKPVPVWGIIRVWVLECLKVSFVKFSQTARSLLVTIKLISDGKEQTYCGDDFRIS